MGPLRRPALLPSRDGIDEPRHFSLIVERPQQYAAAFDRHDQHWCRHDIFGVGVTPDLFFEGHDLAAVVERGEWADVHRVPVAYATLISAR